MCAHHPAKAWWQVSLFVCACSELAERGAPAPKQGCVAVIRVRGIMNTGPGAARMVGPRAVTLYQS